VRIRLRDNSAGAIKGDPGGNGSGIRDNREGPGSDICAFSYHKKGWNRSQPAIVKRAMKTHGADVSLHPNPGIGCDVSRTNFLLKLAAHSKSLNQSSPHTL
jgi:hypothetical protein